jgi:site-specific recombinase XerD
MLKLARHFLRHCSASNRSCLQYSVYARKYALWLGHNPDQIIEDVKPIGAIPDLLRVQNHCGFLEDYLAELQDDGLKPTAVNNAIKCAKTFYRVNGVKNISLAEPVSKKTIYKDKAPTPEDLAKMLDKAPTRDSLIVAMTATGGFREGTIVKLKYRHVKDDLEANIIPLHIHVEAAITKGKYHDYDTFVNAEAVQLLKLYIQERKKGTEFTPEEEMTDDSPLFRNSRLAHRIAGISEKDVRKIVHTLAVEADVAKPIPDSWMYDVRFHSLRKFFRTYMGAAKVDTEIIRYMMGKTVDTYETVQSLGIEALRKMYNSAGLAIRPKTKTNKIDQLKEIIRAWGENPEEILTKDALLRGNITENYEQSENHQLSLLAEQLKQLVKKEVLR